MRQGAGTVCRAVLLPVVAASIASTASALEPVNVRSQSGQFLVRGLPQGAPVFGYSTSAVQYLRLDPTVTAVSFERIKQSILAELEMKDQWRGLISIATHPVEGDSREVQVDSVHFKDGWGYRVDMPENVDKDRFMRVAVRVILSEIANREALTREAELPLWLVEGTAAELQSTVLSSLTLEPERRMDRRDLRHDPLRNAREVLRRRPMLKFDDLCLPTAAMLAPPDIEVFRACSQVFVHELLRLRTGRSCLRDLLGRLPHHLNWQTTFLEAFNAYFQRLIDVDKWYALSLANVIGRDSLSRWPLDTSWKQLDDILATQVQVRLDVSELPINTIVTLQRVVSEWDDAKQKPVIEEKIAQLEALRPRIAVELADLLEDYAGLLRNHFTALRPRSKAPATRKLNAKTRAALKQLDALDARRAVLRDHPRRAPEGP